MKEPSVSVIWVNYNSMGFIDLVLSSLAAIRNLNYENYDLIIVDNASTDGSFQVVKSFVSRWVKPKVRIVRMDANRGYIGACNAGYAHARNSDYVVVMNNDLIPFPDSLKGLIEYLTSEEKVGGAQGIILDYNTKTVDSAGFVIDELLRPHPLFRFKDPNSIKKSYPITYSYGAYSIYSVRSLKLIGRSSYLYNPGLFAYFDDNVLGLRFWMNGFKVKLFPVKAGLHYRGKTFGRKSLMRTYLELRNYLITVFMSNSRWKYYAILYSFARYNLYNPFNRLSGFIQKRALIQAYRISRLLMRKEGPLDVYRVPLIKLSPQELIPLVFLPARVTRFKADYIIMSLQKSYRNVLRG
ncbi:MAG: glycosyltransferase family 2 protein [Thermoprotei archaeon]|nr:glycosyltransferase family 2 protein [Thermoprotei archaeon]